MGKKHSTSTLLMLGGSRSPPVDMEAMGAVHVRMRPAGSISQSDIHLIKVDVILEKATIYVVLSPHEGSWPFVVENESDFEAIIGQSVSFISYNKIAKVRTENV